MARKGILLATLFAGCLVYGQEISDYGLVLGGSFTGLHGADADQMGLIFPRGQFPDEREPFRYATDSTASPTAGISFSAGLFLLFQYNDHFYTRVEASYVRKAAEYGIILSQEETYGAESVDSLRALLLSTGDSLLVGKRRYEFVNSYIEVPVFMGFNFNRDFSVYAGGQFAYLVQTRFDAHIHESPNNDKEGKKSYSNVSVPMKKIDFGILGGANYIFTEQFQLGARFSQNFMPILDNSLDPISKWWSFQVLASFNFSQW